jgi:MerR family transcriptional regulator, thiopeptide resistance regulator
MSTALTPDEKQEVFGSFDPDIHNEEVKSRWGNTDAYKQSAKKTANYTKKTLPK